MDFHFGLCALLPLSSRLWLKLFLSFCVACGVAGGLGLLLLPLDPSPFYGRVCVLVSCRGVSGRMQLGGGSGIFCDCHKCQASGLSDMRRSLYDFVRHAGGSGSWQYR